MPASPPSKRKPTPSRPGSTASAPSGFPEAPPPPVDILSAVNSAGETLPPGPAEEARQLTANLLGWFARFAAQAKTDGELPPHTDAEAFAGALLSLLLGAGILGQSAPPGTAARSMAFPLLFS